jgi:hypothetical protein
MMEQEKRFSETAYVPPSADKQLMLIQSISQTNKEGETVFMHLARLYEQNPGFFHDFGKTAFMETDYRDTNEEKLCAVFEENRIPGRQKWYLHAFRPQSECDAALKESCRTACSPEAEGIKPEQSSPMQVDPIMRSILRSYREKHCPAESKDGIVYGRLVNHGIIENDLPGAIGNDEELLDSICVDSMYDSGIDGICMVINGKIVSSRSHLESLLKYEKAVSSAEILMIQSKFRREFTLSDANKFQMGILNFLGSKTERKLNEKVLQWFEVKNALIDNVQFCTELSHIKVRTFLAVYGKWTNSSEIIGSFNTMKKSAEMFEGGLYQIEKPVFVGDDDIKRIARNSSRVTAELKLDSNPVQLMDSSSLKGIAVRLNASEIARLMTDETTGLLRKGIFEDNVRDYQGNTGVNRSIKETLEKNPESFILRNNGITILASRMDFEGLSRIRLVNPQIVNGCQTCSVIFYAAAEGTDVSKAEVLARVISTDDNETITSIVSGNNNQNIVRDMINEITRKYHKKLEEYFAAYPAKNGKILYERRSLSLAEENLASWQRCTFRNLIQSAAAVWFSSPWMTSQTEEAILENFKGRIFCDNHMEICYYASAALAAGFERLSFSGVISGRQKKMKTYACFIAALRTCGEIPDLNDSEKSVRAAEKIMKIAADEETLKQELMSAVSIFCASSAEWVEKEGSEHETGIYDDPDLTAYILNAMGKNKNKKKSINLSGTVYRKGYDRYGYAYCFIISGQDTIFAHSRNSPDCSFQSLAAGETVVYEKILDKYGQQTAASVRKGE